MIEDKSGRYFDLLKKKGKERKRETRWKESVARPATGSQFPIPSSSRKIHQTLHDQLPSHCDPPRFDRTHYVCPLIFPRAIDKKKEKKSWPFPRLTSAQLSPILWHGRRLEREREREERAKWKRALSERVSSCVSPRMTQRDRFSALSRFAAHTSEPFYKHSCRSSYHRPITCGPCPRNGASSRCVTHHALFLLSAFIALCIPATRYIKTCIKTSGGRANNNDNELTGPICPRWRACCARLDGSHRQTDTVMEIDLFQLAGARYI